ncbi:MAG: hypothetical protein LBE62_07135 [Azonexus sp.]|jgi:hypothetical protein|nr:hypothetical protein [Azonexus sp.]
MGLLADFFVATPEQAIQYANRDPYEEEIRALLNPCEYKGITGLELGMLWAILEDIEWDYDKHMPRDTVLGNEGEWWLERFPDKLTLLLAQATPERLATASVAWANTEELSCDPEDIQPMLADLQQLAKQAISRDIPVYLWGCL